MTGNVADRAELERFLRRAARGLLEREITDRESLALWTYLDLIASWNRVHRLVGSVETAWLVENVILDSLLFSRILPGWVRTVADIGSGVGVPGIPLGVVRPDLDIALIEARRRRASFLATAVRELGLTNCRVLGERAESAPGKYDAALARCAGRPESTLRTARRLVRSGGAVVVSGAPDPEPVAGISWARVEGWRPGTARTLGTHIRE